ncbi:MAG: hypothetical protein AAFY88_18775 [Acidobacteriota bacterium]
MKKTARLLLIASFLMTFAALPAWASGTSYPAASAPAVQQDPLLVTESLKGQVLEIRADQNAVKILDPKTEEISWIQIGDDTRLRAQNRKAFDGRKKIDFADLQVGQVLRIQHRPHTGEVLRIKVLRKS